MAEIETTPQHSKNLTLIGFSAWASGRNFNNVEAANSRKERLIESPPSSPDRDNL